MARARLLIMLVTLLSASAPAAVALPPLPPACESTTRTPIEDVEGNVAIKDPSWRQCLDALRRHATPPCYSVDLAVQDPDGDRQEIFRASDSEACGPSTVSLHYTGSQLEGWGSVDLEVSDGPAPEAPVAETADDGQVRMETLAEDVRPLDLSPSGTWARLTGAPGTRPSEGSGPRTYVVSVAFRVAWTAGGCPTASGKAHATVDGEGLAIDRADLLAAACDLGLLLQRAGGAPPASRAAASVAAAALDAALAARPDLAPAGEPVLAALRALAATPAGIPGTPDASLATGPADPDVVEASAAADAVAVPARAGLDTREEAAVQAAGLRVEAALADLIPPDPSPSAPATTAAHSGANASPARTPLGADAPSGPPPPQPFAPAGDPPRGEDDGPAPFPTLAPTIAVAPRAKGHDALAAAAAAAGLLALVAVALYQRLRRPAALQHAMRSALYETCLARGPSTAGELGAAVGMERKAAEYHLVYLVRLRLLRADETPGEPRRYAPPTAARPVETATLPERVVAHLRRSPGLCASEVALALGVTRTRVDRCVKDLLLDGLLESRSDGVRRRLFAP